MKKNVLLLMNYWPNEETYWLCQQLRSNNVSFRLVGIAERLRKLRYAKFCGNLIWNMVRFVRALKVVLGIQPNELVLVLDDTASSTYTGLFIRLFHKKNTVVCLNMMDNLNGSKIKGALYRYTSHVMYYSVNNRYLIDTYSKLYNLPKENFFVLPDCISNWGKEILKKNETITDGDYIFSGGSSYRDWDLLIDTAERLPQYKFVCVSRKSHFPNRNVPRNLTVFFDLKEDEFQQKLKNSKIVFIPINIETQGGQIVIFEAALYHKPVITTDTIAISQYIKNGENGLLIGFKDVDSATSAVTRLMEDSKLQEEFKKSLFSTISALTPEHFFDMLRSFLMSKEINI